jgi:hypothetical protein
MFSKFCRLRCEMYLGVILGTCSLDPEDIYYPECEGSRFLISTKLHGITTQ